MVVTVEDEALAAFARRCPAGRDPGEEAERLIENAVSAALAGRGAPFDHLYELEGEARRRFHARLAAGEGNPDVEFYVASTGGRLA